MRKEIIVDCNPYQTRVALLEDGVPCEIYIERKGRERLLGNIYKGKVQNVLPGMQAAFVDIGLERNAFLYAGDIQVDRSEFAFDKDQGELPAGDVPNIKDIVKQGQEIMVQVFKEPVGTKGARVTTHVTLPGRSIVLMPTVNYIGVSRRIEDETERARLKQVLEQVKPENMGVIVRTAAEGQDMDEFEENLAFLTRLWERIQQREKILSAPRLIHAEEPLVFRTIRDIFTSDIDRLAVNDAQLYQQVLLVMEVISPTLKSRVELHESTLDLFDTLGLDQAIEKALARKVWLKNGGYIIIDQTEALTSIDVNTGKYTGSNDDLQQTITDTNCAAAREIARQLRLRDISGMLVIDFIDMDESTDQEKVLETLRSELKRDRTKSNVLGITQLGLVEMTRKKTRPSLSSTVQMPCPYCGGSGKVLSSESVLLKVRKKLIRAFGEETFSTYLVKAHPSVVALIEENSTESFALLPREPGRQVWVEAVTNSHVQDFSVTHIASKEELNYAQSHAKLYA